MRQIQNQQIRKLGRTGRGASVYLTLPIAIVRALKWKENQKVVVKKHGRSIIIKDWKK